MGGLAMMAGLILLGHHRRLVRADDWWSRPGCCERAPVLPGDPDPDPGRGLHQVGAVPVPFLAAQRDGRADARQRLSALRHDGQGRRLPDGAAGPDPGRDGGLDGDAGVVRRRHRSAGRSSWRSRQTDLKRILAYTTVTALGQLTMLLGIGGTYAVGDFAVYLLAHACTRARCSWASARWITRPARAM